MDSVDKTDPSPTPSPPLPERPNEAATPDPKPERDPTAAPSRGTGRVVAVALVALALAVMGVATQVVSQGNPNDGDVKTHRDEVMDPPTQDNPHVDCDGFWIEGFNMEDDFGHISILSWEPTGDGSVVVEDDWEADGGSPAHHFLSGPYTLDAGHYRLEVSNGEVEPGQMKMKMFWVDACDDPEDPDDPEEPGELVCPSDLQATANGDGSIRLDWTVAAGSDGTNVYRAVGDGELEYVTTVGEGVDTYLDEDTEVGESYAYSVTGLFGDGESVRCPVVEVTSIPNFPTVVGFGLATLGGVAAIVLAGRRKP